MKFDKLYVNGNIDPVGTGKQVTLAWSYACDGRRNETQTAFRVEVRGGGKTFDSGVIAGNAMRYPLPEAWLTEATVYRYTVYGRTAAGETVSAEGGFETALWDYSGVKWLTCGEDVPSPVFVRKFTLPAKPASARAYITGVGLFTCRVNGENACDRFLMPANTTYDVRRYVETIPLYGLHAGENTLEIQLGGGYNADFSRYGFRYDCPKGCLAALIICLENGEEKRVYSDENFLWRESSTPENSIYHGETCDARRMDLPLRAAIVNEEAAPKGTLVPDEMPPIRAIAVRDPVDSWATAEGTTFDFGVNAAGIEEITVTAPAGTVIKIHTCEMADENGDPDYFTNRGALAADTYICAGTGEEHWRPAFTYHGFRYATVSGLESVSSFSIRQIQLSADLEGGSSFLCSDPAVNRIHELVTHSLRCNFVSIPTDCPVRDERTPCQMDSQMVEAAAIHNFNMESYYLKWLKDITGLPLSHAGEGNPDWHGDYIMLSYRLWRFYGNDAPMRALYPRIIADVEAWMEKSGNGIITTGFGDWCPPNPGGWDNYHGSVTATNTALYYADLCIAEEMSAYLGEAENAAKCRAWKQTLKEAFAKEAVHEDGSVLEGKQTELLMPVYYGLISGDLLKKVAPVIKQKLTADGCLDTGAFATSTLPAVAKECGAMDALMTILRRGAYPGYGYLMAKGATSLWEQWRYKGPMNSHGHAMHGGIDAAFYRVFCGITTVEPAYRSFRIAPALPDDMSFAVCTLRTASGTIKVDVRKLYQGLEADLVIPPNTKAEFVIPEYETYAACGLFDGEKRIEKRPVLHLGSGVYRLRLVPEKYIGADAEAR